MIFANEFIKAGRIVYYSSDGILYQEVKIENNSLGKEISKIEEFCVSFSLYLFEMYF